MLWEYTLYNFNPLSFLKFTLFMSQHTLKFSKYPVNIWRVCILWFSVKVSTYANKVSFVYCIGQIFLSFFLSACPVRYWEKEVKKSSHKDDFSSFFLLQLIFALCILIPLYAYYTRLYYQVHRNLKLYVPSNFNLDHYREFFFFALESILYVISSALAAFFWKKFLCYIFFHLFTFTLPVSLYF